MLAGSLTRSIKMVLQPYMFYKNSTIMFEVIGSHEEWYSLQMQRTCNTRSNCFSVPGNAVIGAAVQETLGRSAAVDIAGR